MNLRGCGVCIAAFFTVSIAYAVRYGCGMLLPGMQVSLEITKTLVGEIYVSSFIGDTVFLPILGSLSDRFDSRLLLTNFSDILATGAFLHLWLIGCFSLLVSFAVLVSFTLPGV